jgi:polar amino acid transport system substrate-binding protein
MSPRPLLAALVVSALVSAGCSGDAALPAELTAAATTTAAPVPTTAPPTCTTDQQAHATASYPALSPLPASNALPAGSFEAAIKKNGKLKVGVSADTLLFGSRNPLTGQLEGFDIDMLKEVAKAIFGVDDSKIDSVIEYHVIRYDQRIPFLQAGTVDIVAHTMTINCKRWQQIAFTTEYFSAGQRVLVRTSSGWSSIDDVAKAKGIVCAPNGSTNLDELNSGNPRYAGIQVVGKPDISDCLVALQQGKVDALSGDDTVLAGLAKQDANTTQVVGEQFTKEPYGLGINASHTDFVQYVNGVLDQLRTKRWGEIYAKWLVPSLSTTVISPPTPDTSRKLP